MCEYIEVSKISNFKPCLLIRASAGTGKTFQLSNRYLRLLIAGVDPDQILATTFTRKAAGEILDRVVLRLASAAINEPGANKLGEELHLQSLDSDLCRETLHQMIKQIHLLNIETLDSYFAKVARAFCLELDLPPDWTIAEETAHQRNQHDAIRLVLAQDEIEDLISLLAKGDADRGVWQLATDAVNQLYELFQGSTQEAWNQFPKTRRLNAKELDRVINEFESIEMKGAEQTARDTDVIRLRDGHWEDVVSKGLLPKYIDGSNKYRSYEYTEELIECLKNLATHAKGELLGSLAEKTKSSHQLLQHYDQAINTLKTRSGALRFDDVTQRLSKFVRRRFGSGDRNRDELQYRLDQRISHLLLDEFQDTAPSQWHVLSPIIGNIKRNSKSGSFFCVGDTKQAIFGWRGGEARLFDSVEQEFSKIESDPLNRSYRSSTVIMDFVNDVFTNLPRSGVWPGYHEAINSWVDQFPVHSTARDIPGFVEVEFAKDADSIWIETAQKTAEMHQLHGSSSIGILVRKNDRIALIINELSKLGIVASEEGGNALTDSPAVQIILSALQFADHPADTTSCFHALSSPVAQALEIEPGDVLDLVESSTKRERKAAQIRKMLADDGYCDVIEQWAYCLANNTTRREVIRLQQLVEFALTFQRGASLRPSEFVAAVQSHKREDPSSARVRVMTIHKAKGLEFDSVIIPDLDAKIISHYPPVVYDHKIVTEPIDLVTRYAKKEVRSLLPKKFQAAFEGHDRRVIHEVMCELYVALTRAIHSCHVIVDPATKADNKKIAALVLNPLNMSAGSPPRMVKGDENWWRHLDPSEESDALTSFADAGTRPPVHFAPSQQIVRNLPTDSPSNMEGSDYITLGSIFKTPDKQLALDRGTLIHAGFEQIEWIDQSTISKEDVLDAIADVIVGYDVDSFVDEFMVMLIQPNAQDLLSLEKATKRLSDFVSADQLPALQLTVFNEHPIAVVVDGVLLKGFIDRLVVASVSGKPIAAEIIDFKTDRLSELDKKESQQRVEHYRPQLNAYRQAIAKNLRVLPGNISATLLFVDQDKRVSV